MQYKGGIVEYVTYINRTRSRCTARSSSQAAKDGVEVEVAMQYTTVYTETLSTFANSINTHEGGTHLSGYRAALTKSLNDYAKKNNLLKKQMAALS